MKKRQTDKTEDGFTLVEILVAILIFSVIAATIFTSFNSLFASSQTLGRDIALAEMGNRCLNRMVSDIRSAHIDIPPHYLIPDDRAGDEEIDPFRIVGDSRELRFASLAHLPIDGNPVPGIARIVYYTEEGDDGLVLKRADDPEPYEPFEKEGRNDPALCEKIISLKFGYHYEEDEVENAWDSESADYQHGTPRAISIRLEMGSGAKKLVMETMATLPVCRKKKKRSRL